MTRLERNNIWEVVGLVISENHEVNEAVRTFGSGSTVIFEYAKIADNKLVQSRVTVDMYTLELMTIPTLRMFTVEIINHLRNGAS